jgi:hypothetical protein
MSHKPDVTPTDNIGFLKAVDKFGTEELLMRLNGNWDMLDDILTNLKVASSGDGVLHIEAFPRVAPENDDTGRLNRIFKESKDNGWKPVRLQENTTYYVNDTILISSANVKPFIFGQGYRSTIIDASAIGSGKPAFKIKGGSGTRSGGMMVGIGFKGNANSIGVQVSGTNGFKIDLCQFGLNKVGLLLHNETDTEFTEFVTATGCDFLSECAISLEYRQTNGVDSFHGSGLIDCTINQSSTETNPKILIGAGCLPYHAPLTLQVWARIKTPIIQNLSTKRVNFKGHITAEIFTSVTGTDKVEMVDSTSNQVVLVGGMSSFDDQSSLGNLILADRIQVNADGSMNVQRKPYQKKIPVTTGSTNLVGVEDNVNSLVSVYLRGSNYDYSYLLNVYKNQSDGNGKVTTLATNREFNSAGYGPPTFTFTGGKLVVTNANFPTSGINAFVAVSEIGTRYPYYME